MLDPRRAALWQAMSLGPEWVLRRPAAPAADLAAEVPAAGAATEAPLRETATAAPPALAEAEARTLQAAGNASSPDRDPFSVDSRARAIAAMDWPALEQAVASCTACALCATRTQTVFGVGCRTADWMLVGEAPGAEEDARGEPFVGQAGRLLDNMLAAVGRSRAADAAKPVFIANVLKCRPPGNRNPQPEEVAACEPFLLRQIELVRPRLLLVMGRYAAQSVLRTEAPISALRGRVHRIAVAGRDVPVVVTYHPAYLLRNLADKAKAWADLCLAQDAAA
jgi:DNA polymerase